MWLLLRNRTDEAWLLWNRARQRSLSRKARHGCFANGTASIWNAWRRRNDLTIGCCKLLTLLNALLVYRHPLVGRQSLAFLHLFQDKLSSEHIFRRPRISNSNNAEALILGILINVHLRTTGFFNFFEGLSTRTYNVSNPPLIDLECVIALALQEIGVRFRLGRVAAITTRPLLPTTTRTSRELPIELSFFVRLVSSTLLDTLLDHLMGLLYTCPGSHNTNNRKAFGFHKLLDMNSGAARRCYMLDGLLALAHDPTNELLLDIDIDSCLWLSKLIGAKSNCQSFVHFLINQTLCEFYLIFLTHHLKLVAAFPSRLVSLECQNGPTSCSHFSQELAVLTHDSTDYRMLNIYCMSNKAGR
mmetsp:Transcript_15298/g.24935  ORF Transcript_15298/g.24935 Transcript_15298/m.24935 type:complete len:358 (+) Transcript_15298:425-1498(+)